MFRESESDVDWLTDLSEGDQTKQTNSTRNRFLLKKICH